MKEPQSAIVPSPRKTEFEIVSDTKWDMPSSELNKLMKKAKAEKSA